MACIEHQCRNYMYERKFGEGVEIGFTRDDVLITTLLMLLTSVEVEVEVNSIIIIHSINGLEGHPLAFCWETRQGYYARGASLIF